MSGLARRARMRRLRRALVVGLVAIGTCAFAAATQTTVQCGKGSGPIEVTELESLLQVETPWP